MDNNNTYSDNNTDGRNNTNNNARDSLSAFLDPMSGNFNSDNNNSNMFVSTQPPIMVMGSSYEQSIGVNNNNNSNIIRSVSSHPSNITTLTPQQILMLNNNNNNSGSNNRNLTDTTFSNGNNIDIKPQQLLLKRCSPASYYIPPVPTSLTTSSSSSSTTTTTTNNNNNNNMGALNINVFDGRNPMMTNSPPKGLKNFQQQQRVHCSRNISHTNNVVLKNKTNNFPTNNSFATTVTPVNTLGYAHGNINAVSTNEYSNLLLQRRRTLHPRCYIIHSLYPSLQRRVSMKLLYKQYELFMKSLIADSKRRNLPLKIIPMIQNKKINLLNLYLLVAGNGGYEEVTRKQLWSQVAKKYGIGDPQELQGIYYNILFEYEKYRNTPEGKKESQVRGKFLQKFLDSLLKKAQSVNSQMNPTHNTQPQNQTIHGNTHLHKEHYHSNANQDTSFGIGLPNVIPLPINPANIPITRFVPSLPNAIISNAISMSSNPQRKQFSACADPVPVVATDTTTDKKSLKKPKKPRQKGIVKKELSSESKPGEEQGLHKKISTETQEVSKKIDRSDESKSENLPKIYKRSLIRNYKQQEGKIDHINGYDINHISEIGERIVSNKPIFMSTKELGSINLHAISMSLQCKNIGEITNALNTLLITSVNRKLKISLDQCPTLLNSLTTLAIDLFGDLTRSTESTKRNTLYDKRSSIISNYTDQYDVKEHFNNTSITYSSGTKLIDDVFNKYIKPNNIRLNDPGTDKVISVDSLTGWDINQIGTSETTLDIEIPSNSEINAIFYGTNSRPEEATHEWTNPTPQARPCSDIENLSIFIPSYVEALSDIKREMNSPFSGVNKRDAEDISVLILDQLTSISMILRNISFSSINSNIMSQNPILKRYFSDLSWLLFTNNEKFKFHRKLLNFKKDMIITLSNISHNWKIESYTAAVTFIFLVLSFGVFKRATEGRSDLTFDECPLNMYKYQSFGVDTLAKLLSLSYPNRQYLKIVLLNNFSDKNITVNDDVKAAKKLVSIYNEKGNLYNDLIGYLFSVIPFEQLRKDKFLIKEVSPVISQVLTSLYYLLTFTVDENNNNNGSEKENILLKWLTGEENLGINLRKLSELYQDLSQEGAENQSFYNNLSCMMIRLLRFLVTGSALDPTSCEKIAKTPNLLPSEAEFFDYMVQPSGNAAFANEVKLLFNLKNKILGRI